MIESVILVIYGWKSVEPGTLMWVFPSVAAAAHAAHAMTNAAKWAILPGSYARTSSEPSLDLGKVRAAGGVLLEAAE